MRGTSTSSEAKSIRHDPLRLRAWTTWHIGVLWEDLSSRKFILQLKYNLSADVQRPGHIFNPVTQSTKLKCQFPVTARAYQRRYHPPIVSELVSHTVIGFAILLSTYSAGPASIHFEDAVNLHTGYNCAVNGLSTVEVPTQDPYEPDNRGPKHSKSAHDPLLISNSHLVP